MPKKQKNPSQKKSPDKNEILKELAESLKSEKKEDDDFENSENLEESDINLQNFEFHQFMTPGRETGEGIGAPILERIAASAPRPVFVGGISQASATTGAETESSDDFKYVASAGENNEPKYVEYSPASGQPERIDFERAGRNLSQETSQVNQDAFFRGASELSQIGFESPTKEAITRPERIDVERAGRQGPFEQHERERQIKYKKYEIK